MNKRLANNAGAFLSTCLYNIPPRDGPTIKANVALAVNLPKCKALSFSLEYVEIIDVEMVLVCFINPTTSRLTIRPPIPP